MRRNLMWGMAAMVALGACTGQEGDPADTATQDTKPNLVLPPVDSAQVAITVSCAGNSEMNVDLNTWVVHLNSGGALSFVVLDSSPSPNSGLDVDIRPARRQGAPWPFRDTIPGKVPPSVAKGVGRANSSTNGQPARYAIDVKCGQGPNRRRVVIDPDIFVD